MVSLHAGWRPDYLGFIITTVVRESCFWITVKRRPVHVWNVNYLATWVIGCPSKKKKKGMMLSSTYLITAERHKTIVHRHCLADLLHCRYQRWTPTSQILDPICREKERNTQTGWSMRKQKKWFSLKDLTSIPSLFGTQRTAKKSLAWIKSHKMMSKTVQFNIESRAELPLKQSKRHL